jgi:hypothetical protein
MTYKDHREGEMEKLKELNFRRADCCRVKYRKINGQPTKLLKYERIYLAGADLL